MVIMMEQQSLISELLNISQLQLVNHKVINAVIYVNQVHIQNTTLIVEAKFVVKYVQEQQTQSST